jgi:hypothetical protein
LAPASDKSRGASMDHPLTACAFCHEAPIVCLDLQCQGVFVQCVHYGKNNPALCPHAELRFDPEGDPQLEQLYDGRRRGTGAAQP